MSRHPWLTFALIGLVPAVLLSGNVLGRGVALSALFPALAAVLIAADGDAPAPVAGHLAKRTMLAAGVVAVMLLVPLTRGGLVSPAYDLVVAAVPAALTAWVLSGAYSPSPGVRRLVQPLASADASGRSWIAASLSGPAAAAGAVIVCGLLPGVSVVPLRASAAGTLTDWTIAAVLSSALAAIGWYAFAARHLLGKLPPLAAGLVIGAAQCLVTWPPLPSDSYLAGTFGVWRLAGFVAAGIIGMWVYDRSRGSLLPVWLLGALLAVSHDVASLTTVVDDPHRIGVMFAAFTTVEILTAAGLAATGRMWRSPRVPDSMTELSLP